MQKSSLPVEKIFLDRRMIDRNGTYEFTIDCGAVYFGAVYDGDGSLKAIDQYFYTKDYSRDDLGAASNDEDLLNVDDGDFPVETYLLNKNEDGNEWLRFHAVVPDNIDPDYFSHKYIGE